MNNIKLNGNMKRTLIEKGYSVKNIKNGKTIEYDEENFIQIVEGDTNVLIFWKEHAMYFDKIEGVWPDRSKIRIKVKDEGFSYNLNIRMKVNGA